MKLQELVNVHEPGLIDASREPPDHSIDGIARCADIHMRLMLVYLAHDELCRSGGINVQSSSLSACKGTPKLRMHRLHSSAMQARSPGSAL